MRGHSSSRHETGLTGPVFLGVGFVLMAFAPVIRGGNRHVALILLEWLALLSMLVLAASVLFPRMAAPNESSPAKLPLSGAIVFLALSPLWVGIVQLMPLPPAVWESLPGREVYSQALAAVQMPIDTWHPLSLAPDATWISALAGLPLAATFLMGYVLPAGHLAVTLRAIVFFAFLQAILGLSQVSLFREMYFDAKAYGRAIGSFANPNHLASYIVMTLPLTILALREALQGAIFRNRRKRRGTSGTWSSTTVGRPVSAALLGSVLLIQLAALLSSQSRAGIGTGILVAMLSTLLLPFQGLSRRAWWGLVAAIFSLFILILTVVGIDGLLSRFDGSAGGPDDRWMMVQGTWKAAVAFWPFGSGLGTFSGVFPRFAPAGFVGYASHAHSDYLQMLMENGALFVVLASVALWLVAQRIPVIVRSLQQNPSDREVLMRASCGFGLLAVFLHSWVDFNLRIPATAMLATFLFGAFLRPLNKEREIFPDP